MNAGGAQAVQWITVEAVGDPGARTFYLQSRRADGGLVSLLLEKTQAMILAEQIDTWLSTLVRPDHPPRADGRLQPPDFQPPEHVMFRAGRLALQYDEDADLVRFEVDELRGIGQGTPQTLRLWMTAEQTVALGKQARSVAAAGLPIGME